MRNPNCDLRNGVRGECERAPILASAGNAGQTATARSFPVGGQPRAVMVEKSTVRTKRARGAIVDGAIGVGPVDIPVEHISRSLTRFLRKGLRTPIVREIDGVPYVVSKDIPEGVFVLRTADRITAYRAAVLAPAAVLAVVAFVSVQDPGFSAIGA